MESTNQEPDVSVQIPDLSEAEGLIVGDVILFPHRTMSVGTRAAAGAYLNYTEFLIIPTNDLFSSTRKLYATREDAEELLKSHPRSFEVVPIDLATLEKVQRWVAGSDQTLSIKDVFTIIQDYFKSFDDYVSRIQHEHREARSKLGLKVDKKRFKPLSKIYLLGDILYSGPNTEPWKLLCHLNEPFFEDGQMKNIVAERHDGLIF